METGEAMQPVARSPYPRVSVVIPTFNRLHALERVLLALERQRVPSGVDLEVVVVDDGSTDGTWSWLQALRRPELHLHRQANSGPARARNAGLERAGGELILFLGDDTEPEPDWLVQHLEVHRLEGREQPLAVVGYTSFPPILDSPFSRFVNEFGAQFGYLLIERAATVPFNVLYTSNMSIPRRELVSRGGFREDFPAAAWEDIEFAYRALGEGLRLVYQPRARALHRHRVRPRTFCRRQRTSGRSAAIFARLHPELEHFLGVHRPVPGLGWRLLQRTLLQALVSLGEVMPGLVGPGLYQRYLDVPYLEGLAEGLQSVPSRR